MELNLPNKLTLFRIVLIIPFTIFMLVNGCEGACKWIALVIFIVASATDWLDGHIARKYNLITDFGKFADPLADKILVCSALICLVSLGRLPAWICIVIIARDFIISGFRLIASDNGIVIAASWWGKTKTTSQMIMVILLIIGFDSGVMGVITQVVMYAALVLTVVSLADYIMKNINVLTNGKDTGKDS